MKTIVYEDKLGHGVLKEGVVYTVKNGVVKIIKRSPWNGKLEDEPR